VEKEATMSDTSFWKKALSVVADFDEAPAVPKTPQPISVPVIAPTTAVQAATDDSELVTTLMTAALSRKTVFSGLIESAEKLKTVLPDELQRIKAAAAMTGTVTAAAIKTAVDGHLQDVNTERSKFTRELASMKATNVDAQVNQAIQLEDQASRERAELERLTASIANLAAQATQLRASADAATVNMQTTTTLFSAAADHVDQRLAELRDTIISALAK
jgi:hypothetical protein